MQLRMIGSCGPLFKLFLCFDVYSDLITESSCFVDRGVMVLGAGLFYFLVIFFKRWCYAYVSRISCRDRRHLVCFTTHAQSSTRGHFCRTRCHFLFIIIPSFFFYCRLGSEPLAHFPELWNGINHAVSLVMPYPQPFRTPSHGVQLGIVGVRRYQNPLWCILPCEHHTGSSCLCVWSGRFLFLKFNHSAVPDVERMIMQQLSDYFSSVAN